MTYFGFLAVFICIPILVLLGAIAWLAGRVRRPDCIRGRGSPGWSLVILAALALVYTTPWDNVLVANQVWTYNPALVSGLVFGWVPLEEYTFFILQTILGGLAWGLMARLLPEPVNLLSSRAVRATAVIIAGLVWVASAALLFSGWKPGTYLAITLFWALPALIPQLAAGADILWWRRRLVGLAVLPLTVYLSIVDALAISSGTWAITPAYSTGLFIGRLPVEESIFFFVTNLLISSGMTLMTSTLCRERLSAWKTGLSGRSNGQIDQHGRDVHQSMQDDQVR